MSKNTGCPDLKCTISQCSCYKTIEHFDLLCWFLYGQRLQFLISMLIFTIKYSSEVIWIRAKIGKNLDTFFFHFSPINPLFSVDWKKNSLYLSNRGIWRGKIEIKIPKFFSIFSNSKGPPFKNRKIFNFLYKK